MGELKFGTILRYGSTKKQCVLTMMLLQIIFLREKAIIID